MNTQSFSVGGQCECGAVKFRVTKPAEELYHCHCMRCRRLHGSLFATYAYNLRADIEIDDHAKTLKMYRSTLAHWHFCSNCGCQLFAEHDHNPGVMWYMPATLDDGDLPGHPVASEKHIFVASASALEPIPDSIERYDTYAPPEQSVTARRRSST